MSKKCIIYCRVSTPTQSQQGESLDAQENICRNIAENNDWEIIKVYKEPFSGRKGYRQIFDGEIMKFLKQNSGKVDYLIVREIGRITRAGTGKYEQIKKELREYKVELIDSMGIIQPQRNALEHLGVEYDWSRYSSSDTTEVVMAENKKQEVRDILTRTIGREIELVREGFHIGHNPDGFIIKKMRFGGKKKSILVQNTERAQFYIKMFEMRASGNYEDQKIVDKINALGFKSIERIKWNKAQDKPIGKRGGKLLTIKQLQSIVQRPIYCGIISHKMANKPVRAKFDGLISIETFNKANRGKVLIKETAENEFEILYNQQSNKIRLKRSKHNPLFPYKFVLCEKCNKPFLASSPKGKTGRRFPTYHCSRNHEYHGYSKKDFESNIEKYIYSIKFRPKFLKLLEEELILKYRKRQKEITLYSAQISNNVSQLKIEQAQALDTLLTTKSDTAKIMLEEKIEKIEFQIKNATKQRTKVEISEDDIRAFIKYAKNIMEHPGEMLKDSENVNEKRTLFEFVFDGMPTYQEIVNGTPKLSLPFEVSSDLIKAKSLSARAVGIEGRELPLPQVLTKGIF
ncbi:hypothetical protein C0583_00195 [Candidatus Parcubacteria bacterium]|nr:MAG: hypothetical protein C0583_00195 [Candidatus Parcubacteria bacterium]